MNNLTTGKSMTVKEIAEQTGVAYRTVAEYAKELFPELVSNGKTTYLKEAQVTIILEKMKLATNNQHDLASRLQGVEAPQSRALRIDLLHRQIEAEMESEIAELKTEVKTLTLERDEATQEAVHAGTAFDYLNHRYHQPSLDRWKKREVRMPYKD
jgi:transposase